MAAWFKVAGNGYDSAVSFRFKMRALECSLFLAINIIDLSFSLNLTITGLLTIWFK